MIYFDNAATGGRKPDAVLTAVSAAMKVCANPGRGGHKLSLTCAKLVQECRYALDAYFGGYGFDRVIFTKNCTEALNIAIFGVLKKGDHVVTTCMEHNSVLRPLAHLKEAGLITYDVCPLDHTGNICPKTFASFLKDNTKMAIVTTASNVTGQTPPIAKIREAIPKDVLLLCDGAQGGGHIPLSMQKMGVDMLSVAGHKGMMGIQGGGALLFSPRVDPSPLLYGGTGSMSLSLDMPDFYPDALEAGTLSFPAILSLLEGVRFLTVNGEKTGEKLLLLTEYLLKGLTGLSAYTPYSTTNPCGILSFAHKSKSSEQVAEELSSKHHIAVRGGLHCAPLMHEALGSLDNGLVRVSLSHFNSIGEIDLLLSALQQIDER